MLPKEEVEKTLGDGKNDGGENPFDLSIELWRKLTEIMRDLNLKKDKVIEAAKQNGMSLLAKLIDELWRKFQKCW